MPDAPSPSPSALAHNRRRFTFGLGALGLGASLLPGALTAVAGEAQTLTAEHVRGAARIAGLDFSDEEIEKIVVELNKPDGLPADFAALTAENLPNHAPPAFVFNPLPVGFQPPQGKPVWKPSKIRAPKPAGDEDLAFLPVTHLARLIEKREITSTELTKLYLSRLKKYGPELFCVVTLTEELALHQARQADEEIRRGRYRGPLHGIPWGAKDLLAVRGYPTTWGASPYKDQRLDFDAAVYERLTAAGAVLLAKLSMGSLAQGDRWFGGRTRSPWNRENGSSGSSAGSGAATAAGLVGFAIGTETRGSIISPSRRCGVTGLRPTYGRVSRFGAMTLSWTMDKIGPMCRSAEDCALVFDVLNGADPRDPSPYPEVPFSWDAGRDPRTLRVGYLRSLVEGEADEDRLEQRRADEASLALLRTLGIDPKPIDLPSLPDDPLGFILTVEAVAAFDGLHRGDRDASMRAAPEESRRPDSSRLHRFVPAFEWIQANRVRRRIIDRLQQEVFADLDLFLGSDLGLTNLTGHPEISLPNGFASNGEPLGLSLTGKLFGEPEILLLAHTLQKGSDYHQKIPYL
ncbi:MAG: amidase [Acidobacteria bacterium]|nr:amidase [Acidobacteriota bacterium]